MAKKTAEMPGKPATVPKPKTTQLRVQATEMGYYDFARRRVGDVFTIEASDFSPRWMERVPDETPVQVTTR